MKRYSKSGKSGNHKFAKRLATYAVGVAGATGLAAQADAGVVPVTFGFGPSWESSDQYNNRSGFDVTGPSGTLGRIGVYTSSYVAAIGGGGYWGGGSANAAGSFVYGDGVNTYSISSKIKFLSVGTVVGTGLNGTPGTSTAMYGTMHWRDQNGNPAYELATNIDDFYFGFKTTAGFFGWAEAGWQEGFNGVGTLTIKSAYVQDVQGDPITVGDTGAIPEPTTLALLAAGAAGLVRLRRRNGAAS